MSIASLVATAGRAVRTRAALFFSGAILAGRAGAGAGTAAGSGAGPGARTGPGTRSGLGLRTTFFFALDGCLFAARAGPLPATNNHVRRKHWNILVMVVTK